MTEITDHLQKSSSASRASTSSGRAADSVHDRRRQQADNRPPRSLQRIAPGLRHFGESYVQEASAEDRRSRRAADITWHFVGKLQTNKTRQVAERFDWVHTVDRIRIAERLNEQRPAFAAPFNVLIQVNQGGEPQKGGVVEHDVARSRARSARAAASRAARAHDNAAAERRLRRDGSPSSLRCARDWLREGIPLDTLSMGMSADFEDAIAAGATLVRIGTAIFGAAPDRLVTAHVVLSSPHRRKRGTDAKRADLSRSRRWRICTCSRSCCASSCSGCARATTTRSRSSC